MSQKAILPYLLMPGTLMSIFLELHPFIFML